MENDRAFAEALNDCLDAIEAGQAGVKDCLARYPQYAARLEDLLRLSDEAGTLSFPTPTPEMLTAGERQLVQAARSRAAEGRGRERKEGLLEALSRQFIEPVKATVCSLPEWVLPFTTISASIVALFVCVVLAIVGGGLVSGRLRVSDVLTASPPAALSEEDRDPAPLPSPTITGDVARHTSPPTSPTTIPEEHDSEPAYTVFLPLGSKPLPPHLAMLEETQGVVEVQGVDGTWSLARDRQTIGAGVRVRTGALSRVEVSFYDGSTAYLGPDTEVSIDALGEDPEDQSRIVELTQWVGETDHDVAPSYGANGRYEVHTPSGTGEAKGTFFHVSVTLAQVVHFRVDEGAVAVTHLDVTVIVVAGQLTTVHVDEPPTKPVFRVTGEGEVEATGTTWRIAGQDFQTDHATVVVGNPQVGDWVHVEGHLLADGTRVADWIVLLRRAPANRFTIVGEVQATGAVTWTVAGQEIAVDDATEIDDDIQIGDRVRVEGVIRDHDGAVLLAETIALIDEQGLPFSFVGVAEDITETHWLVSGISVTVDSETVIDPALVVGDVVRVRGVFLDLEGGTWLARSIEPILHREPRFAFVGLVEGTDPWVVSGIPLETRTWTEIEGKIEVGDRVKVKGRILPDGAWLAEEIELLDAVKGLFFAFVGTVEGIEPWVVSGISLTVNAQTEIVGEIKVGDQVKVEGQILPGGELLATEIKRIDRRLGRGCMLLTSLVVRVSATQVVLHDGATIPLDTGVHIDGEIQVNSVIVLYVCVDDQGNVTVVSIIVLYQTQPVIIVHPPPPGDDDDDRDDDEWGEVKVTICHKPQGKSGGGHTIVVAWPGWVNGHKKHGDTLGRCVQ